MMFDHPGPFFMGMGIGVFVGALFAGLAQMAQAALDRRDPPD